MAMPHTTTRNALWGRVQVLMVERWGAENQNRLAREAGVGVATIARMKGAGTSIGVDVLEKVACALGVQAWQLMCPDEHLSMKTVAPSSMALDLAAQLDQIADPAHKRQAYAIASQVISFGSALLDNAAPEPAALPTPAHRQAG